jgi:hypothetical protein
MYGALSSDKGAKHFYDYGFVKQENLGMALRTASATSRRDSSIHSVIIWPAFMVLLPLVALEVSVK